MACLCFRFAFFDFFGKKNPSLRVGVVIAKVLVRSFPFYPSKINRVELNKSGG